MQQKIHMTLKILLPFQIYTSITGVMRIVVETCDGSFGFLPYRLDCVTAIVPGILIFETKTEGEVYIAVDEGVLIKSGLDVRVSVRNAITGTKLAKLQEVVEREFLSLNEQEQIVNTVMVKMENSFIHRLKEFHGE